MDISNDEDLERDTITWFRKYGNQFACAADIGLELGLDRRVAAARMKRILTKLVKSGFIERSYDYQRPIIYRLATSESKGTAP